VDLRLYLYVVISFVFIEMITIVIACIDQVDEIKEQVDSIVDPLIDKVVKDKET
jgi:hypothetical protein